MLNSIKKALGIGVDTGMSYRIAMGCAIHGCKVARASWGGKAWIEAGPTVLPIIKVDATVYPGDEKPTEWDYYDPTDEDQAAMDWKLL